MTVENVRILSSPLIINPRGIVVVYVQYTISEVSCIRGPRIMHMWGKLFILFEDSLLVSGLPCSVYTMHPKLAVKNILVCEMKIK